MHAYVYKSLRKQEAYLYLREKDAFGLVPDVLRSQLGPLAFVLDLDLPPGRRLARADAEVVKANLLAHGFYLQVPPLVLDPLVAGGVGDG